MAWSKFSTTLIEVLARHLGDRSRPAQIVKEAAAQGDALRLLAAGERDAEKIRRGQLDVEVPPGLSRVPARPAETAQQLTYGQQIVARIVHRELKREHNLEKIAYYASEEEGDGNVGQERDLDEEWLTQFFKNAQDVSTEQLQRLWARLLAGEIKSPGSYSIDTIDFLRRMTSTKAKQIQRIGPYLFGEHNIVKCDFIQGQEWSNFVFWLDLDNLGIIDGVEGLGLQTSYESRYPEKFEQVFMYGTRALICKSDVRQKKIDLAVYRVTSLGREVLSLGRFEPDYEYLLSVAHEIKKQSFSVFLADVIERMQDGHITCRNVREIA